jgi:apolipoprotein N-acyltransferase
MKALQSLTLVVLVFLATLLLSPKWLFPLAAWILPFLLVRLFRKHKLWQATLLVFVPSVLGSAIANYGVVPYPLSALVSIMLIGGLFGLLPLLLDRWLYHKMPGLLATLAFPALSVILDYFSASGPQGVWGNLVNTQYGFLPLLQLSAYTGIWGIGFLIYWSGPVINLVVDRWQQKKSLRPAFVYGSIFLLVLAGGGIRLLLQAKEEVPSVKVAGISVDNLFIAERMYEAEKGQAIQIPAKTSQSDPLLSEVFSVYAAFFAETEAPRFATVQEAYQESLTGLLQKSTEAVHQGAKVIAWSEGSAQCLKSMEKAFIRQGQDFARKNQVWFFYPMAVFIPEKFASGQPYLENKVLTINPQGEIVNTYFKNVPVPDLEPSVPGDGKLHAFETPYGRISPAICYDADFPAMMRQLSALNTELLVLPSGDWDAIDPLHGRMALIRGIENGTAVLRPVNQAHTLASDAFGRVLARDDFFADGDHLLITEIPMQAVQTFYGRWGDWFVVVCGVILLGLLGTVIGKVVRSRR